MMEVKIKIFKNYTCNNTRQCIVNWMNSSILLVDVKDYECESIKICLN